MSPRSTPLDALAKIPFKNAHSESVPAFGVMQVTGSVIEDGVAFLLCTRPGTTLGVEFAINGASQVHSGEKGVCYRQGDLLAAYDEGSPEGGQGWGPRADQWTLSRGYAPIITVHSIRTEPNRILHGSFGRLTSVLGVAAADLPPFDGAHPGSQTVALHVWDGTSLSPAAPATTFTGHNISTSLVPADVLTQFVDVHGLWIAVAPDPAAHKLVKTTTSHPAGASEEVNVWDGDPGEEEEGDPLESFDACNRTDVDIPADVFCLATRINGHWYIEPWACG